MRLAAPLLIGTVLLITGCSGGQPSTPTASNPAAEAIQEAPVERWAGLVAERQLDLDEWFDGWEGATCSALAAAAADCNTMLVSASFISQTNYLVIAGPSDPDSNTYLGEVPAEISDLYDETVAVTASAQAAGEAWSAGGCSIGVEGDCITLAFDFERALGAVRTKFAAWSPYL